MLSMLRAYAVFTFACALLAFFGIAASRALGSTILPADGVILYVAHVQQSFQRDLYALDVGRGLVAHVARRDIARSYTLQNHVWLYSIDTGDHQVYEVTLYALEVDGARARVIEQRELFSTTTHIIGYPNTHGIFTLSLDGTWLLFAQLSRDQHALSILNIQTGVSHNLWSDFDTSVSTAGWAPDDTLRSALIVRTAYGNYFLCLFESPASTISCFEEFLDPPAAYGLAWSPERELIAYGCLPNTTTQYYGVCLIDPHGMTSMRRVDLPCTGSMASAPAWSLDSTHLLASCSNGNEVSQIYRVEVVTGAAARLPQTPTDNHSPVWVAP